MAFSDIEKSIIKYIRDNPYAERKTIVDALKGDDKLEEALDKLAADMTLIELTAPSDSSLESRY